MAATKLKPVDAVVVGTGLAGSIICKTLAETGIKVTVIGRKRALVSMTASMIAISGAPICHMSIITSWPGSAQIVIVDTITIHSGIPLENASAPKPM